MGISYNVIEGAFLSKITEFELIQLPEENRTAIVDGYRTRAVAAFKNTCKYDLSLCDDVVREYTAEFADADVDEIVEIISDGMVVQWMKPYAFQQENLQNAINTRDYTTYSPAELLTRIGNAYKQAKADYTQAIREYSYNHGDLTELHL